MNPINTKIHKTGITYGGESVTGTKKREGKKKKEKKRISQLNSLQKQTDDQGNKKQVKTNINSIYNQNTTVPKSLELFCVPEVSTESPSSLINLKHPS